MMSLRARLASRLDLVLQNVALHHQLMVLERSNRRSHARTFDGSDRWLWVFLSLWWPRWREALTIIQPQTVVRCSALPGGDTYSKDEGAAAAVRASQLDSRP